MGVALINNEPALFIGGNNFTGSRVNTGNIPNSTVNLASLSDLSITVAAAGTYTFYAAIFAVDSQAAEGLKFDFNGGNATMTSFRCHAKITGSTLITSSQVTAISTAITAASATGDVIFEVSGSFVVSQAGTFIPRFAQNSHSSGTATVYKGSYLWVQ